VVPVIFCDVGGRVLCDLCCEALPVGNGEALHPDVVRVEVENIGPVFVHSDCLAFGLLAAGLLE